MQRHALSQKFLAKRGPITMCTYLPKMVFISVPTTPTNGSPSMDINLRKHAIATLNNDCMQNENK